MLLNLKPLGDGARGALKTLDFADKLDLSAIKLWGENPFLKPVKINGEISSVYGAFILRYEAEFETSALCSRCLAPVVKSGRKSFEHTVVICSESDEIGEDFIPAPNGELLMDGLVAEDLLLSVEGVALCREDCRGLCPKCGRNLNNGDCGCDLSEPDLRFRKLRDLLEE